jgi:dihydrofolate reductase
MATIYYTASSVDGFIADAHNSLDWLFPNDIDQAGPMAYPAFIAEVGSLAMGATTYQWLLDQARDQGAGEQGSAEPFYEQPVWVFTHRAFPKPAGDVRFIAAEVSEVYGELVTAAAGKNTWVVGGGGLAGQFAEAGLLDEVWVQYAPVTLGSGAPLLPRKLELTLINVARNRDFCCVRYAVGRVEQSGP